MIAISLSKPSGMFLSPPNNPSCELTRFIKLSARDFSATGLATIFATPVCPVTTCLTFLTRAVPPLPTVEPSCQGPMCVFLFRAGPEPLVEVLDTAEFRLESNSELDTLETGLCWGELTRVWRTARLPLPTSDSFLVIACSSLSEDFSWVSAICPPFIFALDVPSPNARLCPECCVSW